LRNVFKTVGQSSQLRRLRIGSGGTAIEDDLKAIMVVVGKKPLLRHLDLNDLVASTEEQYVQIAVRLAHDLARLLSLRQTLRQRTRSSPITDGRALALEVEAAYRSAWSDYCRRQNETKLT
jgi:hypothetical protein